MGGEHRLTPPGAGSRPPSTPTATPRPGTPGQPGPQNARHHPTTLTASSPPRPPTACPSPQNTDLHQPPRGPLTRKAVDYQVFASGASRDRTGDLLLAKQIGLSTRVSWCRANACKCRHFCWPREDTKGRRETNWCPPGAPSAFVTWGGGKRAAPACPAASARGCGRGQGRSCVGDRRLRVEPRHILELVHHVAIRAEGEPRVVAELASDVDHRAPLVE